jgi:hypothetical protein
MRFTITRSGTHPPKNIFGNASYRTSDARPFSGRVDVPVHIYKEKKIRRGPTSALSSRPLPPCANAWRALPASGGHDNRAATPRYRRVGQLHRMRHRSSRLPRMLLLPLPAAGGRTLAFRGRKTGKHVTGGVAAPAI